MIYKIQNKIGDEGGFGSVHICVSELGDKYAIKLLRKMDASSTERFKKEIRLIKRLSHPNIIKIITYDADCDQKYYIMPLYNSSLKAVLPDLYGNYDRQYKVISEILNGVIYLHSEGVLHRDLKPENILYNSDSDIVINDFGFSRQVDSESTRLTSFGAGFGTMRYAAPEQFVDASNVTEKTDIFSLGKIIEDIVTNIRSFEIPTEDLAYIIHKCTEDDPNRRFNSVLTLKEAVDSVYQHLLGIVENGMIDTSLSKIRLGNADKNLVLNLASHLISCNDNDKLEDFFRSISNDEYKYLEENNNQLAETLIIRLQEYYTLQLWGFGYTDIIGDNCKRLYDLSKNIIVKANLLFTIIEVGISHNRFHVMDLAKYILKSATHSVSECIELANLLLSRNIKLNALKIDKADLPASLQPYYEPNAY